MRAAFQGGPVGCWPLGRVLTSLASRKKAVGTLPP